MINYFFLTTILFNCLFVLSSVEARATQVFSLEKAIELAIKNDPWLYGSTLKQRAVEHQSVASGALPDPTVSLGMMNLPTDSWDFQQEAMTQIKVGVSQMLPRGDSRQIKQRQLAIAASKFPLLREDRKANVTQVVTELWLDAYLAQRTIALIEQDSVLFEQMAEVAQASYSSGIGKTRQQDVIRAQLEIIQLEDKLTVEQQQVETALAKLNEWLYRFNRQENAFLYGEQSLLSPDAFSGQLPQLTLSNGALLNPQGYSRQHLATWLAKHPAVLAIDVKQQVSAKKVALAKQQYQPQWGFNASYAYRDDMPSGDSRADLFSIGVTFDVPLFTKNKQDKALSASVIETEAVKTEKLLLIKKMISAVEKEVAQLQRLSERQSLYQTRLLTQTHDQAEAALTAYTNDDGDFAEVVRARIAELNARIAALKIDVEALKTVARINYLLSQSSHVSSALNKHSAGE